MSSIRVPVISQIVALGIKRATADMSPYVRRAAAQAIPKCYRLDPNTLPLLTEQLSTLLGDKQYYVVGAAVQAFLDLCPERLDLIHPHYRSLARKLIDMDEWGQLATLRLMVVYARKCFPRRTKRVKKMEQEQPEKAKKGFYDDDSDTDSKPDDNIEDGDEIVIYDPDLKLILDSCKLLLQSRNSAVKIAVARCYLYLADFNYLDLTTGPLISLLRTSPDIQTVALQDIVQICLIRPDPFIPYTSHFLISSTDTPSIQDLKLELLTIIFPHAPPHTRSLILTELSHFSNSSTPTLVRAAVSAIGRCAQTAPTQVLTDRCLHLLLAQLSSSDTNLVSSSLDVIRQLVQRDPSAHRTTVVKLAKNLDSLTAPSARANIIWLVGEFASSSPETDIGADVLRILVRGFAEEDEVVQQQIILLAARVYLRYLNSLKSQSQNNEIDDDGHATNGDHESTSKPLPDVDQTIPKLFTHILLLSRYSPSYDLRDRARLYRNLLATPSSTELATLLLLAPKPVPLAPSPSEFRRAFTLGSASFTIGNVSGSGLRGYEYLPVWVQDGKEPDPKLRDEIGNSTVAYRGSEKTAQSAADRLDAATVDNSDANGLNRSGGVAGKSLDDWLGESEDDESEEGEDEETEEESEEETEEEEEEESEEQTDDEMEQFLNS